MSKFSDRKFKKLKELTKMVSELKANGLIITGKGGMGKTYNVIKTLDQQKLIRGKDYERITTYSTPREFFNQLYIHRNKRVLVIDDIANSWKDKTILGMLKSGLDDIYSERVVEYWTTHNKGYNSKFVLRASLIIISNNIPKNKDTDAIISRCHYLPIEFSKKDIKEMLKEFAINYKSKIPLEKRIEIANHLANKKEVNLRLLNRAFELYDYDNVNWKQLI